MTEDFPSAAELVLMEERIVEAAVSLDRHRARQRRSTAVLGVAALLAAAGGTAWVALASPAERSYSTYCYAAASTDADYVQVGSPDDGPGARLTDDAVELCASAWRVGLFEHGRRVVPRDDGIQHPVPNLIVCRRSDRVPAVFPQPPGAESPAALCDRLGLLAP